MMEYKILYPEAFPVVECSLRHGEAIKAESDAMIAMDATVDVEGKMEGGVLGGIMRRVFTGESFFLQRLVASRGAGKVLFGHPLPGGIMDVALDGSYGMIVQKGGFLAAEETVNIDSKMQGLMQGFFSQEGFFLLKLTGKGIAFLSSYGVIHVLNLEAASNGWISSVMSGECLVCRFRGPGPVLIQTRNPSGFETWIQEIVRKGGK